MDSVDSFIRKVHTVKDYISRKEALEMVRLAIERIPSENVKPVKKATTKEIWEGITFYDICSKCKTELNENWKYCPECGAKLER